MENYIIDTQIGREIFDEIYKGHEKLDNIPECIQVIPTDGMNSEEIESIRLEISVFEKLNHPNIVQFKISFEESNNFYILAEHVTGDSLSDILHQQPNLLAVEQIHSLFDQMVDPLNYMHSEGVIHRNIRPHIVFQNHSGPIKKCYFCLSKNTKSTNVQTSVQSGLFHDSLPEYFSPNECLTQKSDVWSFGVL
jgi:serine/threonine protein kinase